MKMNQKLSRRQAGLVASAASFAFVHTSSTAHAKQSLVPVRQITRGPKHHWFGYYDKREFDLNNRFVLSNQVHFEGRTPKPTDEIRVGMVDLFNGDRWIELGKSSAWGWQQGCMLQWRPTPIADTDTAQPGSSLDRSRQEVLWNDREGGQAVCRVLNVTTGTMRTLPRPIYTLSNNGKFALTADFARIQRMRPGYGYVGIDDPCHTELAPQDSGVWKMDLDTGETELVFSLADAAKIPFHGGKPSSEAGTTLEMKWNYFNHILLSPDDERFIVLHRWRENGSNGESGGPTGGFTTRMFTLGVDGQDIYELDPSGNTSHFIWKDSSQICAWTKPFGLPAAFYLFEDQSPKIQVVGKDVMTVNGHNTYVPGTNNEWILNDTYPSKDKREQSPYLYHVPTDRRVWLGHFHSPPRYSGEWRCDTHPRNSNDGQSVVIDSPHSGEGRQLHLIDISQIVA